MRLVKIIMNKTGFRKILKNIKKNSVLKRISILIGVSIIIAGVIELCLFIPIPSNADNNSWLVFWGSVLGAIIGGIVTLWGLNVTIKSTYLNVKPLLRPVRTDFYVYLKDENMTMTDKNIVVRVNEYFEKEEINFFELDEYMLEEACSKVANNHKGTKWESDIEKIDIDKLYEGIKEICKCKRNEDAFKLLYYELVSKYDKGFDKDLMEEIRYELKQLYINRCAINIIHEENEKWRYFMPLYNVGAGNALDIEVKWDTSDNSYKEYCDKLGFDEKDYLEMKKSFSLDALETLSADILKIKDGEDKRYFEIPCQIIGLIEVIIYKSFIDKSKDINTNVLLDEDKMHNLK